MGETNPRLLALLLEDLAQDLESWGMRASDLAATAALKQRQTQELVTRTVRLAAIAIDKAQNAQAEVAAQQAQVDSVQGRNGDATVASQMLLTEAEQWNKKAEQALTHWEGELRYAIDWEARATERVAAAEKDLAQAQAALQSAEWELDRAMSAYNACVNYRDDKGRGRNCAGEAARVREAQVAVAAAKEWVREAKAELAAAKAELERARARVRCTQAAVELASTAVEQAREAVDRATDALTAIERSSEATAAAIRAVQAASQRADTATEQGGVALQSAHQAARHADEADMHLREMSRAEENAQRMRIMAGTELAARIERLYILNRPDAVISG